MKLSVEEFIKRMVENESGVVKVTGDPTISVSFDHELEVLEFHSTKHSETVVMCYEEIDEMIAILQQIKQNQSGNFTEGKLEVEE